jgi:lysophospholipase L1-like esterase
VSIRRELLAALAIPALAAGLVGVRVRSVRSRPVLPAPRYVVDALIPSGDGPPVEIVFLGDSMAAGVGAPLIEDSLPFVCATLVGETLGRPVHVVGHAIGGAKAATTRAEQVPLLTGQPDAVVLVVGGNDVLHLTPPLLFQAEMRALVRDVRAITPGAIVLTGSPGVRTSPALGHPLRELGATYAAFLHAVQRRIARREGAHFADIKGLVSHRFARERPLFAEDEFHPSPAGYAVLAQALAPAIVEALRAREERAASD